MMRAIFVTVAAALLAGCAAGPTPEPIVRVETQTVKVPVIQRDVPPDELRDCAANLTAPKLRDAPGGLLIPESEIPAYFAMIGGLVKCNRAWMDWAPTDSGATP